MSSHFDKGIDPPVALTRRIHAEVLAQRAPMLRTHLRNAIALAIASCVTASVVASASKLVYGELALGLRSALSSPSLLALVGVALLTLLFVSTLAALRRGRLGLGSSAVVLLTTAMASVPLYVLLALAFPVHEDITTVGSVAISPLGARCFVIAALVGAVVLGSFAWAMRAAVPVGTHVRSLAIGSAAGIWAGLAVFVFCPSGDSLHVSFGHVLPVAAIALIGALALPAILRP